MIHVFTYKDGLLAKLAHDLRLSVVNPTIAIDAGDISVDFSGADVRVDGVMKRGTLYERDLSSSQKQEIEQNITKVLKASQAIRFEGQLEGLTLNGELTLNGQTHSISIPLKREGDHLGGRLDITPSQWGIKPFKAVAGAIKLKDRWTIAFNEPSPDAR